MSPPLFSSMRLHFKPRFVEKYSRLTDFEVYRASVLNFSRKSIRVNTLKATIPQVKGALADAGWSLESVPWCREGFYVAHEDGRRDIGNAAGHAEGWFFVQKSVSMISSLALDVRPGQLVLDMAAAPGGKTTHLAALMQNTGLLIANEPDRYRVNGLLINLQRCGVENAVVTKIRGENIAGYLFDRILLDAPCSGSGLIKGETQKSKQLLQEWNPLYIKKMARVQKRLLAHAYDLLRPGGILVYSTCSLEPEENEEVVDDLLERTDARLEQIDLPVHAKDRRYLRIWPQDNKTEGFFVAKIRKRE